jgi:uncharacterized membrane protein
VPGLISKNSRYRRTALIFRAVYLFVILFATLDIRGRHAFLFQMLVWVVWVALVYVEVAITRRARARAAQRSRRPRAYVLHRQPGRRR